MTKFGKTRDIQKIFNTKSLFLQWSHCFAEKVNVNFVGEKYLNYDPYFYITNGLFWKGSSQRLLASSQQADQLSKVTLPWRETAFRTLELLIFVCFFCLNKASFCEGTIFWSKGFEIILSYLPCILFLTHWCFSGNLLW